VAAAVYIMCALTSLFCAWLLLRGWRSSHSRLLLWTGICFLWFFVNNVFLLLDLEVFPDADLSLARSGTAFVGAATLLVALVWESR
jgi:hypothetical protein